MTDYEITRTFQWSFDERIRDDDPQTHKCLVITADGTEERTVDNIFNQVGWTTWFRHLPGTWDQPEGGDIWASQYPERVLRSEKAERLFWFWRKGDGGLLKSISVLPGQRLTFEANAHAWSSSDDDGKTSDGAGSAIVAWPEGSQPITNEPWQDAKSNMVFQLGIAFGPNPNPLSPDVVWGPGFHIYNGYAPLQVQAIVPAGVTQATLIARGSARWSLKHNDTYWDEFSAMVETPKAEVGEERGSLLGLHVLRSAAGVPDLLAKQPAMVVLAGDWGLSESIPEGTLLIGRVAHSSFDAQSCRKAGMTPLQAAQRIFDEDEARYLDNPRITHWSGFNEPVWSTAEDMAWFAQVEIERMRLLAGIGRKAVIGDFSTGCPPLELWDAFLPALQFALENECLLGLHEYSTPWMWWMTSTHQVDPNEDQGDEGWTTLRYRKVIRQVLEPAGLGRLRIAITECGLDPGVHPYPPGCPGGTWRQLGDFWREHDGKADPAAYYLEQLAWYDDELRADPQIAGAAVFCAGNFGRPWSDFDVAGSPVITGMQARIAAMPPAPFVYAIPDTPTPPLVPEPVVRGNPRVQYWRRYVLLPPNAAPGYWHAAVDAAPEMRLTIGGSADDAGMGNLDAREVIAINSLDWGDLEAFYTLYYPGVELVQINAITDVELLLKLRQYVRGAVAADAVHVWQKNPVWAAINLGGPAYSRTIGSHGCVLSCYCTLLRDRLGYDARPDELNERLWKHGVFYDDDSLDWAKLAAMFEELVFVRRVDGAQTAATLRGLLADPQNAIIVAVQGGAHFCYLVSVSGSQMTVHDPLYEQPLRQRQVSECSGYRLYRVERAGDAPGVPPAPIPAAIRGIHGAPITGAPSDPVFWIEQMKAMGITWYKSLCTQVDWAKRLLDAGITPVIRLYKGQQFPGRLDAAQLEDAARLVDVGVQYFEVGNEPNLAGEWQTEYRGRVDWHDAAFVQMVAGFWKQDARAILEMGGKPALYAVAPTEREGGTNPQYSSIEWLKRYLVAVDEPLIRAAVEDGRVWMAVHASPFNRPLSYDPYTNGEHPDDMCMRAVEVYAGIARDVFGVVPQMISTEGGAYSPEHLAYLGWEPYSEADWAALTVAMFEFLERYPYLLAMCPWVLTDEGVADSRWKDNGWYRGRTARAVVSAMRA